MSAGDVNFTRFVGNNPVARVDPNGLVIEIKPIDTSQYPWHYGVTKGRDSCCGGLDAYWIFLINPKPCHGLAYWIQYVEVDRDITRCDPKTGKKLAMRLGDKEHSQFLEVWVDPVGTGEALIPVSGNDAFEGAGNTADHFGHPRQPDSHGTYNAVGQLRYFCAASLPFDTFGAYSQLQKLGFHFHVPNTPYTGCQEHSIDLPCQSLRARGALPVWWNLSADGPVTHTATAKWNCCCDKPFESTTTIRPAGGIKPKQPCP